MGCEDIRMTYRPSEESLQSGESCPIGLKRFEKQQTWHRRMFKLVEASL
jgi:hypothetical protein